MLLQLSGWLTQPVTIPLWGFLTALILPVAYLARLAREAINSRVPVNGGEDNGE